MTTKGNTRVSLNGSNVLDHSYFIEQIDARDLPWRKTIGKLSNPTGIKPGSGTFLMSETSAAGLPASVFDIVWTWSDRESGVTNYTFNDYVVTEIRDAAALRDSPKLVTVADPRALLCRSGLASNYNMLESYGVSYQPDSLNGGSDWTWATLLADLISKANDPSSALSTMTMATTPASSPTNLRWANISAWEAIGKLAEITGQVISFSPFTGKLTLVDATATQTIASDVVQLATYNPTTAAYGTAPASITVCYPWSPGEGNNQQHRPPYTHTVATGIAGANGTAIRWGKIYAEPDHVAAWSANPLNKTALDNDADDIAARAIEEFDDRSDPDWYLLSGFEQYVAGSSIERVTYAVESGRTTTELKLFRDSVKCSQMEEIPLATKAGIVVQLPEAGIPARSGATPGSAVCDVVRVDSGSLAKAVANDAGDVEVNVYNASTSVITGTYAACVEDFQGNIWITSGSGGGGVPRIRFKTTEAISSRIVEVEVTAVWGDAIDPGTGDSLEVGDLIDVRDYNNEFACIEPDGIGFAFYHPASTDSGGDSIDLSETDVVDESSPFWAIEQCTLPIDEVWAYLDGSCLLATDTSGTAVVHVDANGDAADPADAKPYIVSKWPNRDIPPEWTGGGSGAIEYTISFQNPYELHGPATVGSNPNRVRLRRITNSNHSSADASLPAADSVVDTPEVEWHCVAIEHQTAMRIRGTHNGGTGASGDVSSSSDISITSFYEGESPANCGEVPTFAWLSTPPCDLAASTKVWGHYDPEANLYRMLWDINGILTTKDMVEDVTWDSANARLVVERRSIRVLCDDDGTDTYVDFYQCEDDGSA